MRRLLAGLAVATTLIFCAGADAADRIFWSGVGSTILVGNLDGTGTPAVFNESPATPDDPNGLVIDATRRWLVYTNQGNSTWGYARLDGSGGGSLAAGPPGPALSNPTGLVLDPLDDRAYIANYNASSIVFLPLGATGSSGTLATGASTSFVYGLTIDPDTRTLFSTGGGKIGHTQLPGGGGGDLAVSGTTLSDTRGIAIDPITGTLWWASGSPTNKISHAKLDGSAGGDLLMPGAVPNDPRGVAIDVVGRRIYWANNTTGDIDWAKLDGSGGGTLFPSDPQRRFVLIQLVPRPTGAPAVSGGSDTGSVLNCSDGSWVPDSPQAFMYAAPSGYAYQWSVDGNDIAGATSSSFAASQGGSYRCRVTASNEAGSASQTSDPHTINPPPVTTGSNPPPVVQVLTKPALSALKQTNKVFVVAKASTPLTGKTSARRRKGTIFSFRLDKAATVSVVIRRKRPGKPVKVTLKRTARAGLNKIAFTGRIRKRALRPGTYTVSFTAKNTAGSSAARTLTFKIVRR